MAAAVESNDGVDVAVIGAGVVGLAIAAELARAGRSVIVFESDAAIAGGVTSRNSEVIHAGIYYPAGSLKARLCVEGREQVYQRCTERGIPHRAIGKWIVAVETSELTRLEELCALGLENGAGDLQLVEGEYLRDREPWVRAIAAVDSPRTGIVDGHALSMSFLAEAEAHGAELLLRCAVEGLDPCPAGWTIEARSADGERSALRCAAVVNAAGLGSDRIAALAGIDVEARGYTLHPCKGDYFALAPGAPLRVHRLVYPVPSGPGLGVHATLDLGGRIRFGPDAEYVDSLDYAVDPGKAAGFARAIERYLPGIEADWLSPDYAGIRPRLARPGERFRDFVIAEESAAGLPGLVSCVGIESPGLTAAPAIGRYVRELLGSL